MKVGVAVGGALMTVALPIYWVGLAYEGGIGVDRHRCRSVRLLALALVSFMLGMLVLAVSE